MGLYTFMPKRVAVRSQLTGVGSLLLHVRPEIELRLLALVAGAFTHEALVRIEKCPVNSIFLAVIWGLAVSGYCF